MEVESILNTLKQLAVIPSLSGYEHDIFSYINQFCSEYHCTVEQKEGVLLVQKGSPKIVFSIHVDRVGFIVDEQKNIEYSNTYQKRRLGLPLKSKPKNIERLAKRYINQDVVLCAQGFQKTKIIDTYSKNKALYVKIHDTKKIATGQQVVLATEFDRLHESIVGQFDNSISIAVALQIIAEGVEHFACMFTANEEIGLSWKYIVDNKEMLKERKLIVCDTTTVSEYKEQGVYARLSDDVAEYDAKAVALVDQIAQKNSIPLIHKQKGESSFRIVTELGRVVEHTQGKINGTTLQIPITNNHTAHEQISFQSIKQYYVMMKALCTHQ